MQEIDNKVKLIQELQEKIRVLEHRRNHLKTIQGLQERKRRTHRLIVWGAELEYWITKTLPEYADQLTAIDDEEQREVISKLFASNEIVAIIGDALKSSIKPDSSAA